MQKAKRGALSHTWLMRADDSGFIADGSLRMVRAPTSLLPDCQLGPDSGVFVRITQIWGTEEETRLFERSERRQTGHGSSASSAT
jgi:hypothetical protein